ncbi:unnamed protein product [Lactuca saligna]|uniref:Signal recognition particle receptor alpha subunit N-terminal domain-containing protein n=1 Tax=Lactuca saligna TaxID=75948 RepID=A0AA35YVF4_LACSI|nr:unnamed protein product [Lactuca saligna]
MSEAMYTCMIFHNMILKDEGKAICEYNENEIVQSTQAFEVGSGIRSRTRNVRAVSQLLIFTKGGLILWASSYKYDVPGVSYTLKWTFHNELGLVFVVVYQKILFLLYVDDLLSMVKREFFEIDDPKRIVYDDFDETFRQLRKEAEAHVEDMKKSKHGMSKQVSNIGKKQGQMQKSGFEVEYRGKENGDNNTNRGAFDVNKLQKIRCKGVKKTSNNLVLNKVSKEEPKKKPAKRDRVWDDSPKEKKTMLDFTDPGSENGHSFMVVEQVKGESIIDKDEIVNSDSENEEDDDEKVDSKKK